jgi:4-hydroxybenzoate polyprenyltransferase
MLNLIQHDEENAMLRRLLEDRPGAEEAALLPQPGAAAAPGWSETIASYIAIARPDHWFKNVFMAVGVVLAFFYRTAPWTPALAGMIAWAFAATCVIASSNYVINEILDAPTDRSHPAKRLRPIPCGRVKVPLAYCQWLALAALGLGMAWLVNLPFFAAGVWLLAMGVIYNVRPIRSKELPYLDVLSESVNNPIRLLLGWFVVIPHVIPPVSLLAAYWMAGAFFMASKRFAELRWISDPQRAAAYRASFRHYDQNKLLVSMFFYATAAALFLGVFIIRYHLELILAIPLIAGFFSMYLHVVLKPDSPAQAPERLYRERGLMVYLVLCLCVFLGLMFVHISGLYHWFNVEPSAFPSLWKF